ncbi:MAG: type IV secretion system DNA-binding domain-containing protein [Polyangiaceae bacterium]
MSYSPIGRAQDVLTTRGHLFLVGRTGSGKTTALVSLLEAKIREGHAAVFVDPHGDAADMLVERVPRSRRSDVVVFDPLRLDCPGLNPFASVTDLERPLIVTTLVATMKKIFATAWGARTEHLIRNAFSAITEVRGSTLEDAARLLFDEKHRAWVLRQVKDQATRQFWLEEVPSYSKQLMAEAIAAPLNKLGSILADPRVRLAITKQKPRLDLYRLLNRNAIVIVRLPKGLLGELNTTVLGSFVLGAFQAAVMRRAELGLGDRNACLLAADEFWNFVVEPISELLAEGRKYGISVAAACQSASMLEPRMRSSLLANAGLVSFRVSGEDGELLAPEFAGDYGPVTLTSLSTGEAVVRLGPERARLVQFPRPQ